MAAYNIAQASAPALLAVSDALSAASLLFALVSWATITKWRQFQNYVFPIVILTSAAYITTYYCVHISHVPVPGGFLQIFFNVMAHWQLVSTVTVYLDIVKVIDVMIPRKFLIANLFAFALPTMEVILLQKKVYIVQYIVIMVATVNCFLYFSVLYVLVKKWLTENSTPLDAFRGILLSTFAWLACGVATLVPVLDAMETGGIVSLSLSDEDIVVAHSVNSVAVAVFFLSMHTHRAIWMEHKSLIRSSISDEGV